MKRVLPYILLATIAAFIMLIWGFAGWQAGLTAAAISVLSLYLSAVLLRDLYGGSARDAFGHLLRLLLPRGGGGTLIVGDGKVLQPDASKQKRTAHGPRNFQVKAENAVVTVLNEGQKLYGPGRYRLEPHEEIKYIYDLRPRQKLFVIDDVLSKDLLATVFHVNATYAPSVHYENVARTVSLAANDPEGAMLQLLAQPSWETAVRVALARAVRGQARTMVMENILTKPETSDFTVAEEEVKNEALKSLTDRGIYLMHVDIEAIVPKPGQALTPEAGWKERARQDGVRESLDALAAGISKVPGTLLRTPPSFETAVREMLKTLRAKPENAPVFTPEMNRRLQDLQ